MHRVPDVVNGLLSGMVGDSNGAPKGYLEVGVDQGSTFWEVRAEWRVGVDPVIGVGFVRLVGCGISLLPVESDEYWKYHGDYVRDGVVPLEYDVILIDGLHSYEQVCRDLIGGMGLLKGNGKILLHDVMPAVESEGMPVSEISEKKVDMSGREWCGDVWKVLFNLRDMGLDYYTLGMRFGLTVVSTGEIGEFRDYGNLRWEDFCAGRKILNLREV